MDVYYPLIDLGTVHLLRKGVFGLFLTTHLPLSGIVRILINYPIPLRKILQNPPLNIALWLSLTFLRKLFWINIIIKEFLKIHLKEM